MKRQFLFALCGFAIVSAACEQRSAVISQGLVETRVAATLTAIQVGTDAAQPIRPASTATAPLPTVTPSPTSNAPAATPLPTPTTPPSGLKPADADSPAAGICASSPDSLVPIYIVSGAMPDVRCMQVAADQRLQFKNEMDVAVRLQLASFDVTIPPGRTAVLDAPCGSYLAAGVHFVKVSAGSVPEIWLVEQ